MDNSPVRFRGFVRVYDPFKGFGFIRREKGKDVFVSYAVLNDEIEIAEGDWISFEIEMKPKGPSAINVLKEGHIG